jgi:hypothetical protein
MTSRATGWPSHSPTAAQIKEFFAQIESGRITKERLQSFLREKPTTFQLWENVSIDELKIGVRGYNGLKRVGIETIGDLVQKSVIDLGSIPNLGHATLGEIRNALAAHGLALKGEEQPAGKSEASFRTPEAGLFELVKLVNARIAVVQQISEYRSMEEKWNSQEASGSFGGELVGSEMAESHRRKKEASETELKNISKRIRALQANLAPAFETA